MWSKILSVFDKEAAIITPGLGGFKIQLSLIVRPTAPRHVHTMKDKEDKHEDADHFALVACTAAAIIPMLLNTEFLWGAKMGQAAW